MSSGGRRRKSKRAVNGHGPEDKPADAAPDEASVELERDEPEAAADEALADARDGSEQDDEAEAAPESHAANAVETDAEAEADAEAGADEEGANEDGARTDVPPPAELDRGRQKAVLESLVFVAERPVTAAQLARAMKARAALVRELIAELMQDYQGRGIELIEVASGYQFRSAAACAPWVREFVAQKPVRLTRAQLETLALIAYRQPITRPEIDDVRGVDSGSAIRVLLERNLIKMLGRKDEAGRPLLYGTSSHFLEFFGMRSLKDLPTLREFTELSEENRALFKKKTGESIEEAEAELLAGHEGASGTDEPAEHVSDEDLAELASETETDFPPAAEAASGERPDDEAGAGDEAVGAGPDDERRAADADDGAEEDDEDDDDEDDDDQDDDDQDDDDLDEDRDGSETVEPV